MRYHLVILLEVQRVDVAVVSEVGLHMLLEFFEEDVLRVELAAHRTDLK